MALFSEKWSVYGVFWRPATLINSGSEVTHGNIASGLSDKLTQCHSFPVVFDAVIAASVICLIFCGSPAAVLWFIPLIIIDPVDGMVRRWAGSHIFVKSHEASLPSRTDKNTTICVPCSISAFFGFTSLLKIGPSIILRSVAQAVRFGHLAAFCSGRKI